MIRYKGVEYITAFRAAQVTGTPYSYVKEHLDEYVAKELEVKKFKVKKKFKEEE